MEASQELLTELELPPEISHDKRNIIAVVVMLSPSSSHNLGMYYSESALMKPYL